MDDDKEGAGDPTAPAPRTKAPRSAKPRAKPTARPPAKPTLKTIAELTGLAVPTVSRALSGASDISELTRVRVREVADRIGYVPNRAGVRLRTGRTNVISLVLSTEHEVMNHTAKLISSVAGALGATPYHLIITPYSSEEDPMRPIRYIVETGSADAVLFNQVKPDDSRVSYLMERGFPFVTHGRSNWSARHAWFDFDNVAFGRLAVETLTGRGRRSIVMVAPPRDQNYSVHMIAGATEAAARAGAGFRVLRAATSDSPSDETEAALRAHVARHPETDALICGSSNSNLAGVCAVESLGCVIGREIDIFVKEATPLVHRFRPEVLTVLENVALAGASIARAAMHRIARPDEPPHQALDVPRMILA